MWCGRSNAPSTRRRTPIGGSARRTIPHAGCARCELSIGCPSGSGGEDEVARLHFLQERNRMNIHKNARTTPRGREWIAGQAASGQTPKALADAVGVCPRTVRKWVKRHANEGVGGLVDRSSRPHQLYRPTPQATVEQIEVLRRQRLTGKAIAAEVGVSPATVSRVLKRLGLNKLKMLEPAEPVRRYEREHPGELIHIDIKKLGKFNRVGHRITGDRQGCRNRGAGWEFVHVCIDDASRIAFSKVLKSERKECAVAFLKAAVAYYERLGVTV